MTYSKDSSHITWTGRVKPQEPKERSNRGPPK
jgi:hypothetical protein